MVSTFHEFFPHVNGVELPLRTRLTSRLPVPLRQSGAIRRRELTKQLEWAWVPEILEF